MAKSKDNLFTLGASGTVGHQIVFRNVKGQTIIAKWPRRRIKRTETQLKLENRFKEATIYAKAALKDEKTRKAYAEKAQNPEKFLTAYNMAIADFLKAPVIMDINLNEYSGHAGEKIFVSAIDDFEVKEVMVEIRQNDQTIVEMGKALPDIDRLKWIYITQSVNTSLTGSIVAVRVFDRPGNITVKEKVY